MFDETTAASGLTATAAHPGGSEEDAEAQAELASFQKIEDVLLGRGGESLVSDEAMRHVVTRLTDEGLVIDLFSLPDAPSSRRTPPSRAP